MRYWIGLVDWVEYVKWVRFWMEKYMRKERKVQEEV